MLALPLYCSHKTTPPLYEIPTINLLFTEPSFFPFAVSKPSFFFLHSRALRAPAWSKRLVLNIKSFIVQIQGNTFIPKLLTKFVLFNLAAKI